MLQTPHIPTPSPRYIDAREASAMIRATLKREFPGVKFGVRLSRYSGGSSVRVDWTDGPRTGDVEAFIQPFAGRGFDGMIDMAYCLQAWLLPDGTATFAYTRGTAGSKGVVSEEFTDPPPGAVLVSFGVSYVFAERKYSPEFMNRVAAKVAAFWGCRAPEFTLAKYGGYTVVPGTDTPNVGNSHFDASDLIWQVAVKTDARSGVVMGHHYIDDGTVI